MPRRLLRSRTVFTACALIVALLLAASYTHAQQRHGTRGSVRRAVVVDERLAALRTEPRLEAPLEQRLGRGRAVQIIGAKRASDGVMFYRVAATRRTRGWVQAESVVSPAHAGDDARLLRLVRDSEGFDRVVRARIFLDVFSKSPLRPTVLLLLGEAAEEAAGELSREAARRLDEREMTAGGAPIHSYFMNYNGLDRYNKQGVIFTYDRPMRAFRYDGASWREIIRRYPHSPEAAGARKRLDSYNAVRKQMVSRAAP